MVAYCTCLATGERQETGLQGVLICHFWTRCCELPSTAHWASLPLPHPSILLWEHSGCYLPYLRLKLMVCFSFAEYQLAKPSDSHRKEMLFGGLAKPNHPMGKFCWGKNQTVSMTPCENILGPHLLDSEMPAASGLFDSTGECWCFCFPSPQEMLRLWSMNPKDKRSMFISVFVSSGKDTTQHITWP